MSTIATTSILHGEFDPMAETAYLLLKREFEYEFVSIRWSMIVGLLLFIDIVALRLILEFDMLNRLDRRNTAKYAVLTSVALVAHLLSVVNRTLYCWPDLAEMTVDLVWIIVTKAINEPSALQSLSIATALGAGYYGVLAATTKLLRHQRTTKPIKKRVDDTRRLRRIKDTQASPRRSLLSQL
jgi:hypothetical protein